METGADRSYSPIRMSVLTIVQTRVTGEALSIYQSILLLGLVEEMFSYQPVGVSKKPFLLAPAEMPFLPFSAVPSLGGLCEPDRGDHNLPCAVRETPVILRKLKARKRPT